MQLYGFKGDVIPLSMNKKHSYIAEQVGQRLRVPLNTRGSGKAVQFFQQLLNYRYKVIKAVNKITDAIHDNDDRRRSLERVLGPSKKKQVATYEDWVA